MEHNTGRITEIDKCLYTVTARYLYPPTHRVIGPLLPGGGRHPKNTPPLEG